MNFQHHEVKPLGFEVFFVFTGLGFSLTWLLHGDAVSLPPWSECVSTVPGPHLDSVYSIKPQILGIFSPTNLMAYTSGLPSFLLRALELPVRFRVSLPLSLSACSAQGPSDFMSTVIIRLVDRTQVLGE